MVQQQSRRWVRWRSCSTKCQIGFEDCLNRCAYCVASLLANWHCCNCCGDQVEHGNGDIRIYLDAYY